LSSHHLGYGGELRNYGEELRVPDLEVLGYGEELRVPDLEVLGYGGELRGYQEYHSQEVVQHDFTK